jgi:hypothetical protein
MNIQGGGLSFEISGTNKQLLQVLSESKKAIQTFSTEAVKGGKDIEKVFEAAKAAIDKGFRQIDTIVDTNDAAIRKLKAQYNELGKALNTAYMTPGAEKEFTNIQNRRRELEKEIKVRQQIINEAGQQADALLKEEQALNERKAALDNMNNKYESIRTQLRKAKEELMQMAAAGKRGTEEYAKQQQEVARLTAAMKSANKQATVLANPNKMFAGVISGLTLMTSGYQAVTGAMGLFAGENENLQRIMVKVQSLMSITMALQTAYTQLNKNSAFQLVLVAKAKDMLTAANARLAAALGISTAAATAFMAAITLGLSAAITGIIYLISKFSKETNEATVSTSAMRKVFEEYHDATATKSANLVGKFAELRNEYMKLKTQAEKTEWIKANQSALNGLELAVYNVKDADDVFINNTPKVIKSLELRAKAMALQELQTKAYEQYYKQVINADNTVKGGGFYKKMKSGSYFTANGQMPDEWKKAGVTDKEANYQWGGGQSGAGMFKPTQAAIDKINAYRIQQARKTNNTIHTQARADLNKTVEYVENELKLTDKEIAALNILKAGGSGSKKGTKENTGGSKTTKDPYAEELKTRKELYAKYLKWVTSEDKTVREAAPTEFAALLKGGTSYLDYLEKQRTSIESKAKKTATDLKNLSTLNNEIAEATKEAVLSDFDAQLNKELEQCKTVGEQLAVIAKKREELKNDNSDVDNAKKERLDTKETDTKEQAKKETAELLKEYAGYLQEKLDFEESYARNRELLTKQAAEASTEEERKVAEAALAALEKKRQEYAKRSGSEQYDKLLEEYQSYQQKQTAIQEKYSQQRAEAEKQGNLAMISQINAKEQEELSKLAASRLMATESWNQLFSDISRLSSSTIKKLLEDINNKKVNLSAQFNPTDLKAINDQLMNARNELEKRNPFLSLKNSLSELRTAMKAEKLLESDDPFVKSLQEKKKQYQDYTDAVNSSDDILAGSAKDAYADLLSQGSTYIDFLRRKIAELNKQKVELKITTEGEEQLNVLQAALDKETGQTKSVSQGFKDAFKSIGSSIDFVSGCFDSVVGGIKKMGISMDEETEAILGDIGGMMDGASQLASGIATGNPLGVIQGSIGLLSSAFDLFNFRDRKAERSIKRHQEAVKKLGYAYNELEHAVDKALGETVYQNQSAVIQNLRAQQNEIQGMISDEKGKKKSDKNRIAEWEEQYREVGRQIEDIIDDITQSITQTTAGDLANNLADALVEAFEGGEDAAKAFGDVANDVLKNAVKNALKLQFLEKPLQNAIKQLQKDMGFDEEGNGTFDGLTEAEQARFKNAIKEAGANFAAAMDMYKDLFTDLDNTDPSTLSGAISSASQESIDLLAGQTNAVRQNQVTSIQLIREQLMHLANMDRGIGVIADRVQSIINHLTTAASDDNGLRSQGITD